MCGERRELVGRAGERQLGVRGELVGHSLGKLAMRIEAGTNRGPADCQLIDVRKRGLNAVDVGVELRYVAGKFLPQRERDRIHQVSASDLDEVGKLPRLG